MPHRKIAQYEDVMHLIERGGLCIMTYDCEIYNLDRSFPGVRSLAVRIDDFAGNEIGFPVFHLKKPMDAMRSIVSDLLTRTMPVDHPDAVDFKSFAAQIVDTLDRYYEYIWEQYRDEKAITYTNKGHSKENEETVRTIPTIDKNGNEHTIRLHEGGKRMSFQVPEDSENWNYLSVEADGSTTKWRKKYTAAEMHGFNNSGADDPWFWVTLYMACEPEIFKTHTKKEHKFRTDMFKTALGVHLWGPQGEEGLRSGRRIHPATQAEVFSFKQSDALPANTKTEGLFSRRGVTNPDKSDFEGEFAHDEKADVNGTCGLKNYMRDLDMPLYTHFEKLADPKYARNFLMRRAPGEPRQFSARPLRAFGRYDSKNGPTSHLGMCIETDERYGAWGQAIMLKLDYPWDSIQIGGKSILQIRDKKKLKDALRKHAFNKFGKVDSLVEQTHLKKTPIITTATRAMETGHHTQEDYELAVRNRQKVQRNKNFRDAVMEIYQDDVLQMNPLMDTPNPLVDQLMFMQVGKPKYFETPTQSPDTVQRLVSSGFNTDGQPKVRDEQDEVYYHAFLEWDTALKNDNAIKGLICAQAIDIRQDDDALADFKARLGKAKKHIDAYNKRHNLGHKQRPDLAIPARTIYIEADAPEQKESLGDRFREQSHYISTDSAPATPEDAQQYIKELRFHTLWAEYNDDPSFSFQDYSWHVEVHDADGHTVPWDVYSSMNKSERRQKWEDGAFDVHIQSIQGLTTSRIARMMIESGELDDMVHHFAAQIKALDADQGDAKYELLEKIKCAQSYKISYMARAALMHHGYPNMTPEDHPYLTISQERIRCHEILQNLKSGTLHQAGIDDIGALEFLADHKDEAERILAQRLAQLDQIERDIPPMTPEQMELNGIDVQTGDPISHIRYTVDPAKTLHLKLPDDHMRNPLTHPDIGSKFVIGELPKDMSIDDLIAARDSGDDIIMTAEKSGELRLAAKAQIRPLWAQTEDGYFSDQLTTLRNTYNNIDKTPPQDRGRMVIIKIEDNPPVAGMRADGKLIDPNMQTIHVPHTPSKKAFEGMVSRKLGNVSECIRGLVLRSDRIMQDLDPGLVRLREMDADGLTGREIEHRIKRITKLSMKKFMQAFALQDDTALSPENFDLDTAQQHGFVDQPEMMRYIRFFEKCQKYGYESPENMLDDTLKLFTDSRHNVMEAPEKYSIDIVDLSGADEHRHSKLRQTMAYFDLYDRPKASLAHTRYLSRHNDQMPDTKNMPSMHYAGTTPAANPK